MLIGIVGPCGSGKSTLTAGLRRRGYNVLHIAQEHSYVPDMWQRITNPDVLIFLQASFPVATQRRRLNWIETEYAEQQRRLAHARQHAHLYIDTDAMNIAEVLERVLQFLDGLP